VGLAKESLIYSVDRLTDYPKRVSLFRNIFFMLLYRIRQRLMSLLPNAISNLISPERRPLMRDTLHLLRDSGVQVNTVLDVGIYKETRPLMEVYPDVKHHLFEPVDIHFDEIRENYKRISYVLHHVALSNEDGNAYLACKSINNTGEVTHSEVLAEKPVDESEYVQLREIRRAKLDTIVRTDSIRPPFLLKIDVDGHELGVLQGAEATLIDTAVVIIEAPLQKTDTSAFFKRSEFLLKRGFYLVDIVDMAYYDGALWQVDLVFVKKDVLESADRLRPFESDSFTFDKHKWRLLNDTI